MSDVVLENFKKETSIEIFLNPAETVKNFGLRGGMQAADFGSGAGHFAIEMARSVGVNGKVSAIDIREEVLEVVESQKKMSGLFQIQTIKGNLEVKGGSGLGEETQDFVLCANILHHVQKPENVFGEVNRVLKPGARLVVIDWFEKGIMGPYKRIAKSLVERLAEENGFSALKEIDAGGLHYGIEFKKI